MKTMKTLAKLTLSSFLLSAAVCAHAANIKLEISNIQVTEGMVMVAVYDTEANYNGGEPVAISQIPVNSKKLSIDFSELAEGDYAIKLFHDENNNGKLDTNLVGMPVEGYGFSNNAGRFGPASYTDARFAVNGSTELTIVLR